MECFQLHEQLAADCHPIGDLALSRVLLLDDSRYPWILLVPRRPALREIYQLSRDERQQLLEESCRVGEFIMDTFAGEKLNMGALGNLVPQLHLHLVVRYHIDPAWPGPVWGHSPAIAYDSGMLDGRRRLLRDGLGLAN